MRKFFSLLLDLHLSIWFWCPAFCCIPTNSSMKKNNPPARGNGLACLVPRQVVNIARRKADTVSQVNARFVLTYTRMPTQLLACLLAFSFIAWEEAVLNSCYSTVLYCFLIFFFLLFTICFFHDSNPVL